MFFKAHKTPLAGSICEVNRAQPDLPRSCQPFKLHDNEKKELRKKLIVGSL